MDDGYDSDNYVRRDTNPGPHPLAGAASIEKMAQNMYADRIESKKRSAELLGVGGALMVVKFRLL